MSQHESPSALGRYHGKDPDLFKLAFKTSILTFLTLGIYRFWAKTRIRKYIWSSATVDGDAFEYTGTGLEKFLGFLVAIVILAIYMGLVQIALFFFRAQPVQPTRDNAASHCTDHSDICHDAISYALNLLRQIPRTALQTCAHPMEGHSLWGG